jgi:hypothetical protein
MIVLLSRRTNIAWGLDLETVPPSVTQEKTSGSSPMTPSTQTLGGAGGLLKHGRPATVVAGRSVGTRELARGQQSTVAQTGAV